MTSKVGDRTAEHAWNKSCYSGIDYTISEDATVFDVVEKLAAYDVGCLVTKDKEGKIYNPCVYMIFLRPVTSTLSKRREDSLKPRSLVVLPKANFPVSLVKETT